MPETSRDIILAKLGRARAKAPLAPSDFSVLSEKRLKQDEKIASYRRVTESVNTEVYEISRDTLEEKLKAIIEEKGIKSLIHGDVSDWQGLSLGIETHVYDSVVESSKERLFSVDASLTLSHGAIAETGSLILWPSVAEPRLLSLTPPIHICTLEADRLYSNFHEAITEGGWLSTMGTNPLLVSGPSKTADIEQELCYGVHGPKQLIVLILS